MERIVEGFVGLFILLIFITMVFPILFDVTNTSLFFKVLIYIALAVAAFGALVTMFGGRR